MSTPSPSTPTWRKTSRSTNTEGDCVEIAAWRKSSRSGDTGGDCVEIAALIYVPRHAEPESR
ncbi:hypothetical protein GCM10023195_61640 [Actinoallomurus liliacearum]|uniref:DUF397 domain-containing protein n=1 Tax=Actinoallomurus liliacearum TaxID=1080073 RepID=A0ABP8TUF1_9ACTN